MMVAILLFATAPVLMPLISYVRTEKRRHTGTHTYTPYNRTPSPPPSPQHKRTEEVHTVHVCTLYSIAYTELQEATPYHFTIVASLAASPNYSLVCGGVGGTPPHANDKLELVGWTN